MSTHERTDARVGWVFATALLVAVIVLVSQFMLKGYLTLLKNKPAPSDLWRPVARPLVGGPTNPPYPVLQVSAPMDLDLFRAREEAELHTYGWINRTSGIVRVPIDRAMDLVLQEGLPTRSQSGADQPGPSPYQLIMQRPDTRNK
ncbi:MAG: hypothetical protein C5B50_11085 [Verrucomicrobia bacterium]|nr:MAG: hypothetical protein C5B50_11085 [Verrucomicrobiota bacterium]